MPVPGGAPSHRRVVRAPRGRRIQHFPKLRTRVPYPYPSGLPTVVRLVLTPIARRCGTLMMRENLCVPPRPLICPQAHGRLTPPPLHPPLSSAKRLLENASKRPSIRQRMSLRRLRTKVRGLGCLPRLSFYILVLASYSKEHKHGPERCSFPTSSPRCAHHSSWCSTER